MVDDNVSETPIPTEEDRITVVDAQESRFGKDPTGLPMAQGKGGKSPKELTKGFKKIVAEEEEIQSQ